MKNLAQGVSRQIQHGERGLALEKMLPSFCFILLPLIAFHAPPTTPAKITKIPECDSSSAFHPPSKQCQPLLTGDLCKDGERLVLNRSTNVAVCREWNCGESELPLYTHPNECVSIQFPGKHCGENQFLVADKSGFGHCECYANFGNSYYFEERFIYWPPDKHCYRVFTRGPCDPGKMFIFDNRYGTAVCQRNPCPDDMVYWLSRGECVSEEDPTLCPIGKLAVERRSDNQFAFFCQTYGHSFAGTFPFIFRHCSPSGINKCKGRIFLDPCPPGKKEPQG
ncbi:unnamed protein product [Darwinula stevensoni]|uniref:DUF4789 domain-containing protein n=1 Tax=Darwinula stevensoni TaxID=69355 RepID=A0A7R9AAI4_9CRUS|nr:unnamed protein product [Darwinula stevensoni]CAG0898181.1 unnamed protein product [Darwinula stevensoni]